MSQDDSPNPLLLEWVKEWLDNARERNSKGITTYRHAYNALKACPIAFTHPSELQQLKGFGPKLCDRLTVQLKKHCEENGLPMPEHPLAKRRTSGDLEDDDGAESSRPAKKRKTKQYVPAYRSGPYALVLALSAMDEDVSIGMTKADLIDAAQPHCDSSFTAPSDPTKFYTAWNSMKTLVQKELVYERGRPLKRYALTDEGWDVAKRIQQTAGVGQTRIDDLNSNGTGQAGIAETSRHHAAAEPVILTEEDSVPSAPEKEYGDVIRNGPDISDDANLPIFTPIRLAPGTFTVHLVLDVREVRAKTDRDYMQEELNKRDAKPIMRSLELGDAMWIAKCHDPDVLRRAGSEGDEVVLDWIVERKRLDDLVMSIKDGRFHEQKFRLRKSGVRNVVYLVEEISMDPTHFQKYQEAVESAIASTQVVNGYFLKKTQKIDDTIRYLARMTVILKKLYESKPLSVIPSKVLTSQNYSPLLAHLREKEPSNSYHISYPAFASLVSKSDMLTLRDIYLKMLMCTRGVTGEKAVEIQKRWKTPYDFVKAFEQCGPGERGLKSKRELVASRLNGEIQVGRKKIPKGLSQKIAEVWGDA
ncbi:Crossover junction endonuclease MUS81 [Pleurostoma richardsiae]|uniref:Crossover junction endonuclease MUS81 n=1 Tax=Pleurostoma richardsiae TaxID=41990 RepID=A0AA38VBW6_9PEZI|nr:Crossover junction endonuclease MUS81 [Pleurostoma richardsiae]